MSSPLSIPCSIPPHVSWELLKAKGIAGGHWAFVPLTGAPLKLFNLDFHPDIQQKNLSLWLETATVSDRGSYSCTLEFRSGITLKRTVHVEVLESKAQLNIIHSAT